MVKYKWKLFVYFRYPRERNAKQIYFHVSKENKYLMRIVVECLTPEPVVEWKH